MKKLLLLFSTLLIAFMGVWVFKSKTPITRLDAEAADAGTQEWWENNIKVSEEWTLDPEIPENYIPVPGENELYMVIDDKGNIVEYRSRTKQSDGSWVWKTVNPDIPENYEAVEGLKDVYKVTNSDGSVTYYKYIRNEDDTFAFVEVDEKGNYITDYTPDGSEIPSNFKHIKDNIYAVCNENGVVIGYKERRVDDKGNYYWVDCDKPQINTGSTSYSNPTGGSGGNSSSDGNGGQFPLKTIIIEQPQAPGGGQSGSATSPTGSGNSNSGPHNDSGSGGGTGNNSSPYQPPKTTYNKDGTYTTTETLISTETKGGWTYTYQTVVTKTYNSNGELQSTKKDGPTEISRVKASDSSQNAAPDKSKIASSLSAEYARVSAGLQYNTSLANSVLANINAERAASGISALSMNASADAYKLAGIRAADMAVYNHADYDSPMYGKIDSICSRFGVKGSVGEVLWKTTADKTADAIASRLKLLSNGKLTSGNYSTVGISIVSKGGYYYINLIII